MTPTKLYPKRKAFLFIDTSNQHSIPVLKDVFLSICLYMISGKVPCMVLRNYNNSTVKKKSLLRDFFTFLVVPLEGRSAETMPHPVMLATFMMSRSKTAHSWRQTVLLYLLIHSSL